MSKKKVGVVGVAVLMILTNFVYLKNWKRLHRFKQNVQQTKENKIKKSSLTKLNENKEKKNIKGNIATKNTNSKSKVCEISNCHGISIYCGEKIPEKCSNRYELGDMCRKYAKCSYVNGECRSINNVRFDLCKMCLEKCTKKKKPMDVFNCEKICAEKVNF